MNGLCRNVYDVIGGLRQLCLYMEERTTTINDHYN